MKNPSYDLVGDIHGHANELIALLETMGYKNSGGCYRHLGRKVIFLGDFIDRGPKQHNVLDLVMRMYDQGEALAVMGNHEFNALAFHTEHPHKCGTWLRPRNNKNVQQHIRFLEEYLPSKSKDELKRVLSFFWKLPLWLDLGNLRVIHACWDPAQIEALGKDNKLTMERLIEASTKGTAAYNAIEALLKGVEYQLPPGTTFLDKDKHVRDAIRMQWWIKSNCTLADIEIPQGTLDEYTRKESVSANDLIGYRPDAPPVFIGHYWMEGVPELMAPNVACLDYSVAKDGRLTAYRWDGEQKLSADKFIYAQ